MLLKKEQHENRIELSRNLYQGRELRERVCNSSQTDQQSMVF